VKRLLLSVTAVCLLAATACTGSNAVDQGTGSFRFVSGTKLGTTYSVAKRKTAGQFTANLLDGGTISLAQQAGKVVLINFWATWCGPCQTETPQLSTLYTKLNAKDVAFIGVDTKDLKNKAQAFVRDNDIAFPIAFDEQGNTAVALGKIPAQSLPFTVLVDKHGKVAAVYLSRLTVQDVRPVLDKLLAES
jgi:peroxiredoxin